MESLSEAARRCAREDLGVVIKNWRNVLSVSYSARDPRDPRYCENELLSVLAAKHRGPMNMNINSAYELRWAKFAEISRDSQADSKRSQLIVSTRLGSMLCSPSHMRGLKKPS